jgi:hypothetical protein
MISEWDEQAKLYSAGRKNTKGSRGIPALPLKRALAYRVLSERTRGLVPPAQRVFETCHGKQDGMDKTAGFAVIHWFALAETQRFNLLITYAIPGWRLPRRWLLFQVTTHALRRLFFRLRSLDHRVILAELEPAVRTICTWYPLLIDLIDIAKDAPSVGIPTPNGVLYLRRADQPAAHSPGVLIATTWVSDTRMSDHPQKRAAVALARLEGGVIIQLGQHHVSVTPQRNLHLLEGQLHPFPSVFYQEMLRHLPPSVHL